MKVLLPGKAIATPEQWPRWITTENSPGGQAMKILFTGATTRVAMATRVVRLLRSLRLARMASSCPDRD